MTYEEIVGLLPVELRQEGNAENLKKVLKVYGDVSGGGDVLDSEYGALLDIHGSTGDALDFIGAMFALHRETRFFSDSIWLQDRPSAKLININGVSYGTYILWDDQQKQTYQNYRAESDSEFRTRILSTILKRKTPTTLPSIQKAIDSIAGEGLISVMENYSDDGSGRPAMIYLTGSAPEEKFLMAVDVAKSILPTGIYILIPVFALDTWQGVYDQFEQWQSLLDDKYIW